MTGVVNFLGGTLENALVKFANTTSANLAGAITPVVVSALTIWVMVYGWAVIRGEVHEPVQQFAWKATKISLILAFALGTGLYQSAAIQGANDVANGLTQVFYPGASSVYDALDSLGAESAKNYLALIERGMQSMPLGGYSDLLAGAIFLLAGVAILAVAGGFVVMAKVFLYFVLAVGPLFIASLAFPPVSKFFDGWLSKILNYVFLLAFSAGLAGLYIAICQYFFTTMGNADSEANALADAADFLLCCIVLILLARQLPNLSAGLVGGSAIGGAGGFIAGMVASKIGSPRSPKTSSGGGGGGEMKNNGGNGSSGGQSPAYRRSTMDQINKRTSR